MEIDDLLRLAVKKEASDIHVKVGLPPILRINGRLMSVGSASAFTQEEIDRFAQRLMTDVHRERLSKLQDVDLGYGVPGLGRFRVNIFQQRGTIGISIRSIPFRVQTLEELHLPPVLEKIAMETRGLILVTGTTGSGKSTTLASMIDLINMKRNLHIITIEDPIEFLHRDKKCIIDQREIGVDTDNFANALRSSLRQDPDVILVGEMRDFETVNIAMMAAETGHLVLSTLHTVDATETVMRIVSLYPPYQQKQIRLQLASILKGVISQRLIPMADGKGRVPAVEVLVNTAHIRECIIDRDRTREIGEAISKGYHTYGMQTFDQSLMDLLQKKMITYETALKNSSNPDDFALRVKGIMSSSDTTWDAFEGNKESEEEGEEDLAMFTPSWERGSV
ncbi:MAG: type IV pili twitching motility protein PilT [Deltaproteobacteria bacterium]|nr:MAG: type IV pili twitching motility protein PilT [Deltaproteobacteria bacterium]